MKFLIFFFFGHAVAVNKLITNKHFPDKLSDSENQITGSTVIVCCNYEEVKAVVGHLTQANIKCTDLNKQFSLNQMSKIIY